MTKIAVETFRKIKENNFGIYKITNSINNKVYVGSSISLSHRKTDHFLLLKKGKHKNSHMQNSYNKYGKDNFKFEIIELVKLTESTKYSYELLLSREQYWIDSLKAYNRKYGYNAVPVAGSVLGLKHSEETKRKASEARKGIDPLGHLSEEDLLQVRTKIRKSLTGKEVSLETRKKLSLSHIGIKQSISQIEKRKETIKNRSVEAKAITSAKMSQARIGLTRSKEFCEKIRLAKLGSKHSEISRFKMSLAKLSTHHSETTKIKMSNTRKGKDPLRHLSENEKNTVYLKHSKPIKNVSTGEIFSSIKDASETYNIQPSNISSVCRGVRKRAGGYKWMFLEDKIGEIKW